MRSLLFAPGDSERKLEKAFASAADIVLVDLEDSVALPAKADARSLAAQFLAGLDAERLSRAFVRVNAFPSGLTDNDLAVIMPSRPAGIMLPKAVGVPDVDRLATRLRVHEAANGIEDGATAILPIITETAAGIFAAPSFASGHRRLAGVTWGAEDLSAEVGARETRGTDGRYTDLFRLARSTTLLAASAAGTAAIDTVFVDFRSSAGLQDECAEAERDGFTGKMAIHPDQVPIINEAFTPSNAAVAEARSIVAAFSEAGDAGVVAIDGRMYDRPHLRRANRLLARHETAVG